MSGEVEFSSKKEALLASFKTIAKTSKYQDRWLADVDVAAAIRHEYELWHQDFKDLVTYRTINDAIKSDPVLHLQLEGDNKHNSSKIC